MSAGVHFRYKSLATIKPLQTILNKPVGLLSILKGVTHEMKYLLFYSMGIE